MAYYRAPRETLMQLFKRGWSEIPEVMGSSIYLIVGLIAAPTYLYYYTTRDIGNHRYKMRYLVYRPEDKHVPRIRRFEDSPPITRVDGSAYRSGSC